MRGRWNLLAYLVLLVSTLLPGCSSSLGLVRLDHHQDYYLRAPTIKIFRYERPLDSQSWIRGELRVQVDAVEWPEGPTGTYRMSGSVSGTTRGHFTSREAAREAPIEAVMKAMAPDNVAEVFEVQELRPGVRLTRIHWDRLRSLELPIDVTDAQVASSFSSALDGEAWNWAVEVVMVWHKVLAPCFSLPVFGTYRLTAIDEGKDEVALTIEQDVGQERPAIFRYRFARGRSLIGIVMEFTDGTVLTVVEHGER